MRTLTRLSVFAVTGAAVLLPMTAASAKGVDSVTRSGACSAGSSWSMRAAEAAGDNAAIRLTVDSARAGQAWSVQMARQGTQFFSGQRTTNAAGDFTINTTAREVNNVNDVYTARARNLRTGEVCSARVVLPD
jgi:hypothetical protein